MNDLEWLSEDEAAQKGLAFDQMCRGWALGGPEFKRTLLEDHKEQETEKESERDAVEVRQMRWQRSLERALATLGRSVKEAPKQPKGADWKVAVVAHRRRTTTASNPWL